MYEAYWPHHLKFNMSTAAVFLDIEEAFDKTWHLGLLYKLSELKFSISLITHISFFLSQRKFRVSVKVKCLLKEYTSRGATFCPVLHIVQCVYKWYAPNIWCLSKSICWWRMYICDRPRSGLYYQKAAARSQCSWDIVWALEHKNEWR
jgi:hypothetical protein